jgi:hypothetical protein
VLIVAVETIGAGYDTDSVETELRIKREEIVIVPRESREVVDENGLKLPRASGGEEGFKAWPVP